MKKIYITASGLKHVYIYHYKPTQRGIEKKRIRDIIDKILLTIDKSLIRNSQAKLITKELKDKHNIEVTLEYVLNYLRNRFGPVKKIET